MEYERRVQGGFETDTARSPCHEKSSSALMCVVVVARAVARGYKGTTIVYNVW